MSDTTTTHYENKTVRASCEELFLDEETADVYFILESEEGVLDRIPAHKCLLAAASDVFKAMFYGPAKEKGDVKVNDITASAITEFLQFFYLHEIKLTMENFNEIMNFGKKYNITECLNVGLKFLEEGALTNDNVCSVYEIAVFLDLKEIRQLCEKQIITNSKAVFDSDNFLTCKHDTLRLILQLIILSCDETDVFKACMTWAKGDHDTLTKELVQARLGQLFYEIRFRSMSIEEFARLLQEYSHIFSAEENSEIIQIIALKDFQPKMFNGKYRQAEWKKWAIIECDRVLEERTGYVTLKDIETQTFTSTEPVLLGEFFCVNLYRSTNHEELKSDLPIEIKITEIDQNYTKVLANITSSLKSKPNAIKLPKPVLIRPGPKYKIQIKSSADGHCHKDILAKTRVHIDSDIIIQFHDNIYIETDADKKPIAFITTLKFNRI